MVEKKERNSNIELMRIISMFFIIIYHINMHAGFEAPSGFIEILMSILICLIVVHVNSYVLVTGYFQSKSSLKISKVIKLNNSVWFYKVLYLIIFLFLIKYTNIPIYSDISPVDTIKTLMPFDYGIYWFIDCYLVLYIISPLLNIIVKNTNKKQHFMILIALFILISCIGTFGKDEIIYTRNGHSLISFIFLYFIGAYLAKYPIEKERILKNTNNTQRRLLYLFLYLFFVMLTFLFKEVANTFLSGGTLSHEIGTILSNQYLNYTSPSILFSSIFYVLFFTTLNIKSKKINSISKYIFGVYLIHENKLLFENMYKWMEFDKIQYTSFKLITIILLLSIVIFIVSIFIEFLRQKLFKFIYNRKIFCRFRKWYRSYLEKLGLKINW